MHANTKRDTARRPLITDPWVLAALPLLLFAAVAVLGRTPGPFHVVVGEDGVLEWLQVAGYVTAAVFAFRLLRRFDGFIDRALLGIAFLGLVVVAGEEIAWGQRVLRFDVDAIVEANKQGDLTLHNIGDGLHTAQLLFAALAVAGMALAVIAWMRPRAPKVAAAVVAPLWLLTWFGMAAVYTTVRLAALPHPSYKVAKLSEVAELAVAVGLAIVAIGTHRAVPRPPAAEHLSSVP